MELDKQQHSGSYNRVLQGTTFRFQKYIIRDETSTTKVPKIHNPTWNTNKFTSSLIPSALPSQTTQALAPFPQICPVSSSLSLADFQDFPLSWSHPPTSSFVLPLLPLPQCLQGLLICIYGSCIYFSSGNVIFIDVFQKDSISFIDTLHPVVHINIRLIIVVVLFKYHVQKSFFFIIPDRQDAVNIIWITTKK